MTAGIESNRASAFGPRLMAWSIAIAAGGLAGYFHGDTVIDGIALVWNGWLMPTFINLYLYGAALCA